MCMDIKQGYIEGGLQLIFVRSPLASDKYKVEACTTQLLHESTVTKCEAEV